MNAATQPRLPGTLSTPAAAKALLRMARQEWRTRRETYDALEDDLSSAKSEVKDATTEVDQAEGDLLAASEDSKEEKAADVVHQRAWLRLDRAEGDLEKVASTHKLAKAELAKARKLLAGARGELQAVREGRRK
jgi:uncharacterized protein YecT (DUF1311 family)